MVIGHVKFRTCNSTGVDFLAFKKCAIFLKYFVDLRGFSEILTRSLKNTLLEEYLNDKILFPRI